MWNICSSITRCINTIISKEIYGCALVQWSHCRQRHKIPPHNRSPLSFNKWQQAEAQWKIMPFRLWQNISVKKCLCLESHYINAFFYWKVKSSIHPALVTIRQQCPCCEMYKHLQMPHLTILFTCEIISLHSVLYTIWETVRVMLGDKFQTKLNIFSSSLPAAAVSFQPVGG